MKTLHVPVDVSYWFFSLSHSENCVLVKPLRSDANNNENAAKQTENIALVKPLRSDANKNESAANHTENTKTDKRIPPYHEMK